MIPDDSLRAAQAWMTPEERAELAWRRWGILLSVLVALSGTAWVGLRWEGDPAFLLLHGSAAILSLGLASAWGAPRLRAAARAEWTGWIAAVCVGAGAYLLAGLAGIGAAGTLLGLLGHPRPFSFLVALQAPALATALLSSYALALAGCGAFALLPRWQALHPRRR